MFKWLLPTVIAVLAGLLVLLGYFVPSPTLVAARDILVRWATVLAAFALVLAYGSLLRVHLGRLFTKHAKHRIASLVLVLSALGTLLIILLFGADSQPAQSLMTLVLVPGQSALLALTAVTLIVGGMRLLRTRWHFNSVVFLAVAVVTLLGAVPLVYPPVVGIVLRFLNAFATGGMRGLLLGVVLGILLTGLRIILGVDRPQSGG